MRGFGYDYDSLRQVKPDLVMLSSCIMGQTGPYTSLAGYGTMAAAISGFFEITGWPDRAPSGPFGAYTDYISPRYLVAALLAAGRAPPGHPGRASTSTSPRARPRCSS